MTRPGYLQFATAATAMIGSAAAGASAPPTFAVAPPDPWSARILLLHNLERGQVGSTPLSWDPALAAGAEGWARYLAATGPLVHSERRLRPGVGENLAMFPGNANVDTLVGLWRAEKRNFVPGVFPANSRTGDWAAVSHYTQMIWPTTTRIGCAQANSARGNYLVCRYSPKGNADGRPVPAPRTY